MNNFVNLNRWRITVGIIFFLHSSDSFSKYLLAPDVIHGGFTDSMKGQGSYGDYTIFSGYTALLIF